MLRYIVLGRQYRLIVITNCSCNRIIILTPSSVNKFFHFTFRPHCIWRRSSGIKPIPSHPPRDCAYFGPFPNLTVMALLYLNPHFFLVLFCRRCVHKTTLKLKQILGALNSLQPISNNLIPSFNRHFSSLTSFANDSALKNMPSRSNSGGSDSDEGCRQVEGDGRVKSEKYLHNYHVNLDKSLILTKRSASYMRAKSTKRGANQFQKYLGLLSRFMWYLGMLQSFLLFFFSFFPLLIIIIRFICLSCSSVRVSGQWLWGLPSFALLSRV